MALLPPLAAEVQALSPNVALGWLRVGAYTVTPDSVSKKDFPPFGAVKVRLPASLHLSQTSHRVVLTGRIYGIKAIEPVDAEQVVVTLARG